jgi:beta-galactosidase
MKKMKFHPFIVLLLFVVASMSAQAQTYSFEIRNDNRPVQSGHIAMGTAKSPDGTTFDVNNHTLIRNGKSWYPIMGEIHYSRIPREKWEESILKMKANGIDIIATYVFWIHHEEVEGQFDWSGNRDLKAFVDLCAKHQMYVWLRIGPWCHGEVRNGGLPDWLLPKAKMRNNNSVFMAYVDSLYTQIGKQVQPYMLKNGGTIIGTQIENEFNFKSQAGFDYMLALKKMAIEAGIDVPYYSVTSWPGTNPNQRDFLLMYGAYPDAPWSNGTQQLSPRPEFLFRKLANDASIGADLTGTSKIEASSLFPYLSAELGGGNQVTYHRRPYIDSLDCVALAYTMMGSGANGLGYYMFAGGVNPIGKLSTLEENKQTNYPNDYSIIDYDFQSPMGQAGQIRPTYHHLKLLHYFANDFGGQLANSYPFFPDSMPKGVDDGQTLRCAIRASNGSGFVFVNQYQRYGQMQDVPNVRFKVQTANGSEVFPRTPITIKANTQAILPFNLEMGHALLKYATVQPVCILADKTPTYVFAEIDGIAPELAFDASTVRQVKGNGPKVVDGHVVAIKNIMPGTNCLYKVTDRYGKLFHVLVLKRLQALMAVKANLFGQDRLLLSKADLLVTDSSIELLQKGNPQFAVSVYPSLGKKMASQFGGIEKFSNDGVFGRIDVVYPPLLANVVIKDAPELSTPSLTENAAFKRLTEKVKNPMANAKPVACFDENDTCLYRTEFDVPADLPVDAYLAFRPNNKITLFLNGNLLQTVKPTNHVVVCPLSRQSLLTHNQLTIKTKLMNAIDALIACVYVVLPDTVICMPTNENWLYTPNISNETNWKNVVIVDDWFHSVPLFNDQSDVVYGENFTPWPGLKTVNVSTQMPVVPAYLNDMFVETTYQADAVAVYYNGRLVNDEFWNGRPWMISLGRIEPSYNAKLYFQFSPQTLTSKFFVDEKYQKLLDEADGFKLNSIKLLPEYKVVLRVK